METLENVIDVDVDVLDIAESSLDEVPVEIGNRRTEVIFLVVDTVTASPHEDPDGMDWTAEQFIEELPPSLAPME